jgi:hypothetical protein
LANSRVQSFARAGLRWLALFHRWVGVALCLLVTLWFASGVVLHFVPYPSLAESERLERSALINSLLIRVTPAAALTSAPDATRMRLVDVAGRPVYILASKDGSVSLVAADTGESLATVSSSDAEKIAVAFQRSAAERIEGPLAYDQWTVAQEFDPYRPLYRVVLADAEGTVVYVSARTGEVLQRTTASQRWWNWCGANIHWLYFSALRAHWSVWDRVVWWASLITLATAVAGVSLGWVRFANARQLRGRRLTPFRGWLGWHHRIGLFAGAFVVIWIFSGWLSMDHGRLFSTGAPSPDQVSRLQGRSLASIAEALALSSIRGSGFASEIILGAIAGRAFYMARGGGVPAQIWWLDTPSAEPTRRIPESLLLTAVRSAWPNQPVTDEGPVRQDSLYSMAESMPTETRAFRVGNARPVRVYIDQIVGHIVAVIGSDRRAYSWLYYALHTFKFPGLAAHPMLRHVAVLGPLALGLAFSMTGIIIAVSRLRAVL